MYQSEADRRNQILSANPALTEFINDIDGERASQAFNNLSHSPESRGFDLRVDYAFKLVEQKKRVINAITAAKDRGAIVLDNWEIDVELWFDSFRKKLKQLFEAYIHSLSACASAFITGPSNFPVARQQKRSQAADKKSENIAQFTTKSPDRFLRYMLPYGSGNAIQSNAPNAVELLQKLLSDREAQQDKMKGANKIVQAVYKKGSQSGVTAEARDLCAVKLAEFLTITKENALRILSPTDFSNRVIAFEKYQLTNNNAEINRLKKRIE